jgi:hypothetical protein
MTRAIPQPASRRVRAPVAWCTAGGLALVCALCAGVSSASHVQAPVQGVALKAAYIYNIALFTTWPGSVPPDRPFAVCARPAHALWDSLRKLEGKPVNGRPWTLLDAGAGPKVCDITVLPVEAAPSRAPEAAPTLFIVDGSAAGKYAGAVTLVDEDDHVRFDIDTREAARMGLKFSSRLLRLARNVL